MSGLIGHRGLLLGGRGGDPYWANVAALLHMDGAGGSAVFPDETGKVWTPAGGVQVSTAQARFGQSAYFDGAGGSIDAAPSTDFSFGTGDFTIEAFARFSSATANRCVIGFGAGWALYMDTFGRLYVYDSDVSTVNILSGSFLNLNIWYHLAVVRREGVLSLYLDGQLNDSQAYTKNVTSTTMRVGGYFGGSAPMHGYVDEVRITKGVGRYTSNFASPAAPFPYP